MFFVGEEPCNSEICSSISFAWNWKRLLVQSAVLPAYGVIVRSSLRLNNKSIYGQAMNLPWRKPSQVVRQDDQLANKEGPRIHMANELFKEG